MKKIGSIIIGVLVALLLLLLTISDIGSAIKSNKSRKNNNLSENVISKEVDSNNLSENVESVIKENTDSIIGNKNNNSINNDITENSKENSVEIVKEENKYVQEVSRIEFVEIDINTIPYSNRTSIVNSIVTAKKVFTNGEQLFYLITLKPENKIDGIEYFNYYVSYNSYNSFILGDMYGVEYEQFNNGVFSIKNLKKFK